MYIFTAYADRYVKMVGYSNSNGNWARVEGRAFGRFDNPLEFNSENVSKYWDEANYKAVCDTCYYIDNITEQ